MIRIVIAEAAARAVIEQRDYDGEHSGRWELAVTETIASLLRFQAADPASGGATESSMSCEPFPSKDFPDHLVFYTDDRDSSSLFIVHVLYGSRDLETLLSVTSIDPAVQCQANTPIGSACP